MTRKVGYSKVLEIDITGAQRIGFKIFKELQLQEKDKIKINMIPKSEWIQYYEHLWTVKDIIDGDDREDLLHTETEDEIIVNIKIKK